MWKLHVFILIRIGVIQILPSHRESLFFIIEGGFKIYFKNDLTTSLDSPFNSEQCEMPSKIYDNIWRSYSFIKLWWHEFNKRFHWEIKFVISIVLYPFVCSEISCKVSWNLIFYRIKWAIEWYCQQVSKYILNPLYSMENEDF